MPLEGVMRATIYGARYSKKRRTGNPRHKWFCGRKSKRDWLDALVNKKLVDAVHQVETGAKNQSLDLVASI